MGEGYKRNIYLKKMPLTEARKLVFEHFGALFPISRTDWVAPPDAVGRVLARPVTALYSSPAFHGAAMDGIAVRAADTFGAAQSTPRKLSLGKQAFAVNTGNPLPPGTDAVIMIEDIQESADGTVIIEAPASPWLNVRKVGEDIVATELLFPRNHRITPYCVGALLAGGLFTVQVWKKPKVLIIPTGNEVVDWEGRQTGSDLLSGIQSGAVIDSNSYVLRSLVEQWGGQAQRHPIVGDDPERLRQVLMSMAATDDFDMILTVGGSSAGSRDFTRAAVAELGTVLVHGVSIMPGKPLVVGDIAQKPVFGIPGYPVSAIVAFEQFVGPVITRMLGVEELRKPTETAVPTRDIPSKLGVEEFLRVKLGLVGERLVATPLPRGAGSITSLTKADGVLRIAENMEGIKAQTPITVEILRDRMAVEQNLVVVGSHDNTLDLIADEIRATHPGIGISSSHVGSMGGLSALKRGVCHLAGSHLLDPADGTYNTSYIRRFLAGIPVFQVHLVNRDQGLIVARGNPKGIEGIEDLARDNLRFINRQPGSGTRVLFDYRMEQLGLCAPDIPGYQTEETTHMAVAVAVASGGADAGLGIYAAAKALDLDFVPVVTEQYDLIIPCAYMETEKVRVFLETIRSERFKERVRMLGGYHTERTGQVLGRFPEKG